MTTTSATALTQIAGSAAAVSAATTAPKQSSRFGFSWTIIPVAIGVIAAVTTLGLAILLSQTIQIYLGCVVLVSSLVGLYAAARRGGMENLDHATDKTKLVTADLQKETEQFKSAATTAIAAKEQLETTLEATKTQLQRTIDTTSSENANLKSQIGQLQGLNKSLADKSKLISSQLDTMKSAMDGFQTRLKGMQVDNEKTIQTATELSKSVHQDVDKLASSSQSLSTKGKEFEQEIDETIQAINKEADRLQAGFTTMQSSLQEEINQLKLENQQISVSSRKIEQSGNLISDADKHIAPLVEQHGKQVTQLQELEKELKDLIGKLTSTKENLVVEIQTNTKTNEDLKQEIGTERESLKKIKAALIAANTQLHETTSSIRTIRSQNNSGNNSATSSRSNSISQMPPQTTTASSLSTSTTTNNSSQSTSSSTTVMRSTSTPAMTLPPPPALQPPAATINSNQYANISLSSHTGDASSPAQIRVTTTDITEMKTPGKGAEHGHNNTPADSGHNNNNNNTDT